MRYAALIFGIIAGVLGLWLGWFAREQAGFDLASIAVTQRMLMLIALFLVPAISIVGGIFAVIDLRVATAAMIGSALGWLGIGTLTGNTLTPLTGAAMLLSAIGGVWALLAVIFAGSGAEQTDYAPRPVRAEPSAGRGERREPGFDAPSVSSARGPGPVADPYDRRSGRPAAARMPAPATLAGGAPRRRRAGLFARGGSFMRFMAYGQTLAALVVFAAIGGVVVADFFRGPNSLMFARYFRDSPPAVAQSRPLAPTPTPPPQVAAAPSRTVEPERLIPRPPPAIVPPAVMFDNPQAYCAQMTTDHNPDINAVRAGLNAELVQMLRQVRGDPDAPVRWRCADKKVFVCVEVGGPVCQITPDAQALAAYCASNPNAKNVLVPAGSFGCDGTRPVIADGEPWAVDRYGFSPRAWVAAGPA